MPDRLADFLRARISEDEVEARRSFQFLDGPSEPPTWISAKADPDAAPGQVWSRPGALWDSGRVLAECEAKRRIVALHDQWHECTFGPGVEAAGAVQEDETCPTLRLLALPYADHAAYDGAWSPDA